jgi:O-antigen ligase
VRINLTLILVAILLTRAGLEAPLNAVDIGIGGLLNFVVIAIGFAYISACAARAPSAVIFAWFTFLMCCVLFSVSSPAPMKFARMLFWLLTYCAVSVIPYYIVDSQKRMRDLQNVVILSSVPPAIAAVVQLALHAGRGEYRVTGTFTHPNIFGFYLVVVICSILLRLSALDRHNMGKRRAALSAYALALGALLIASMSRAAWVGAFLLVVSYVIFLDRRKLPLLVVGLVVLILVPSVHERVLNATQETEFIGTGAIMNSYEWRKALWEQAFTWIAKNPLLGHGGLGTFSYYAPQFFDYMPAEWDSTDAHNVFIQLFFEIGVMGPILFVALLFAHALPLLRSIRYDTPNGVLGVTLCLIYLTVCYSDNMLHYLAFNWYFWFLLGTMGAWASLSVRNRRQDAAWVGRLRGPRAPSVGPAQ